MPSHEHRNLRIEIPRLQALWLIKLIGSDHLPVR